jgi:hypothetical protein
MAYDIIGDFFSIINIGLFDTASILLIISYIVWEAPRSLKILSEEFTKELYPEHGRLVDISLLVVGVIALLLFMMDAQKIVTFAKKPGIISFLLVLLVVLPIILLLGFFQRFFARMDAGKSASIFLTQGLLDFAHTIFYISFALLVIPAAAYLIFG